MLKSIKNENREILSKKYEELTNNYIWIKKYVIGEEIEKIELSKLKSQYYHNEQTESSIEKQIFKLEKKLKLITKIKNKQLKSKEYYIVNYDEFCKDFEITEFLGINISIYGYDWNILYDWITMKKQKFNNLIENIFNIFDKCIDKINYITYNHRESTGNGGSSSNNSSNIHIISMYNLVIQSYTQPTHEHNGNSHSDLIKDYEPIFFEPLMNLTKNIIELIEFFHEEI